MIDYSIVSNEANFVAVRSTVKSFNLDHVTDKDINSFYSAFSKYAQIDTGLLPLEGTGLLAYRQAGNHAQIVVQHAPGIYRVLWGAHENDSNAKAYFVAQPYRIVIGDIENGSLLGARMFYSPVPITSPSNELYHVNLPNINCRGYRGNGVGWVCLYHNEDWSNIPIAEKVARLIERCSGDEAYNDGNMSETDGPRFYARKSKPTYITNPNEWEEKSTQEGFTWTLDPELWIPILVTDRDNQGEHNDNGVPLTIGMALTGDYQAYYTDRTHTKPINAISRSDKSYPQSTVFTIIKKAFSESQALEDKTSDVDPYHTVLSLRADYSISSKSKSNVEEEDEEENSFYCVSCEGYYDLENHESYSIYNGELVCQDCLEDHYCYVETENEYYPSDDCVYLNDTQCFALETTEHSTCDNCGTNYSKESPYSIYSSKDGTHQVCPSCTSSDNFVTCSGCGDSVLTDDNYIGHAISMMAFSYFQIPHDDNHVNPEYETTFHYFHPKCGETVTVCPCGFLRSNEIFDQDTAMNVNLIAVDSEVSTNNVTSCCKSCVKYDSDNNKLYYSTQDVSIQNAETLVKISNYNKSVISNTKEENTNDISEF